MSSSGENYIEWLAGRPMVGKFKIKSAFKDGEGPIMLSMDLPSQECYSCLEPFNVRGSISTDNYEDFYCAACGAFIDVRPPIVTPRTFRSEVDKAVKNNEDMRSKAEVVSGYYFPDLVNSHRKVILTTVAVFGIAAIGFMKWK